jgi:hypothetical protein
MLGALSLQGMGAALCTARGRQRQVLALPPYGNLRCSNVLGNFLPPRDQSSSTRMAAMLTKIRK